MSQDNKSSLELEIKQKPLEKSENVKIFTDLQEKCSGLESQIQNLKEENFKLASKVKIRLKICEEFERMKVCTNSLQEKNSKLESQLEVTQKEKKQFIDKYNELKDKEKLDVVTQTDTVARNTGSCYQLVRNICILKRLCT